MISLKIFILLIGYLVGFALEAHHDYNIILNEKDLEWTKKQQLRSRKWHKFNWQQLFFTSISVSFLIEGFTFEMAFVLVIIATMKTLVFNIVLNYLRDKSISYLSKEGLEGWFRQRELNVFYYVANLITLITSVYLYN